MKGWWVDLIGWLSTAILLTTLARQVWTEWRSNSIRGVSKWLFAGQVAASVGFIGYSWFLHNWVFVGSNIAILVVALVGQAIYARNRRRANQGG
jgi:CHASE2 domain-containing sensor protein